MAVFSGKNLKATSNSVDLLDVVEFEISETADPEPYSTGSTSGAKRRVARVGDVTGSITCKVHGSGSTLPSANAYPGLSCSLDLYEKASDNATKHAFSAVMYGDVTYNANADTGEIVSATITFGLNGQYTRPHGQAGTVGAS